MRPEESVNEMNSSAGVKWDNYSSAQAFNLLAPVLCSNYYSCNYNQ